MSKKPKPNTGRVAKKKQKSFLNPSIIVLIVIMLTSITITVAFLFPIFFSAEKIVKDQINSMSKDYYENHLYKNLVQTKNSSDPTVFEETMQKYQKNGFSMVHLRQLLLYDDKKNAPSSKLVTEYCDENKTYIKFYPEPPFERTSYRIEYTYSCNF